MEESVGFFTSCEHLHGMLAVGLLNLTLPVFVLHCDSHVTVVE